MRKIDLIVVHTSATPPSMDIGRKEIDEWHKHRKPPFRMIGYHGVIRRSGAFEVGRDLDDVGAHVYGYNKSTIGICMVGGIAEDGSTPINNYTAVQFETLRTIIDGLVLLFPGSEVCGHRDLSPDIDGDGIVEKWEWLKDCPCFDVKEWYYGV